MANLFDAKVGPDGRTTKPTWSGSTEVEAGTGRTSGLLDRIEGSSFGQQLGVGEGLDSFLLPFGLSILAGGFDENTNFGESLIGSLGFASKFQSNRLDQKIAQERLQAQRMELAEKRKQLAREEEFRTKLRGAMDPGSAGAGRVGFGPAMLANPELLSAAAAADPSGTFNLLAGMDPPAQQYGGIDVDQLPDDMVGFLAARNAGDAELMNIMGERMNASGEQLQRQLDQMRIINGQIEAQARQLELDASRDQRASAKTHVRSTAEGIAREGLFMVDALNRMESIVGQNVSLAGFADAFPRLPQSPAAAATVIGGVLGKDITPEQATELQNAYGQFVNARGRLIQSAQTFESMRSDEGGGIRGLTDARFSFILDTKPNLDRGLAPAQDQLVDALRSARDALSDTDQLEGSEFESILTDQLGRLNEKLERDPGTGLPKQLFEGTRPGSAVEDKIMNETSSDIRPKGEAGGIPYTVIEE